MAVPEPRITSASHAWNTVHIILGYILHCYLGDLSWGPPVVGISAALGAEDVRMPMHPQLHSKETTWPPWGVQLVGQRV